jgi:hypothetical protein
LNIKFKYNEGLEKQANEQGYTFGKNKKRAEELRQAFELLKKNDCIPTSMIDIWIGQRMYNKLCSMLKKKG